MLSNVAVKQTAIYSNTTNVKVKRHNGWYVDIRKEYIQIQPMLRLNTE